MKKIFLLLLVAHAYLFSDAQNVGIGTAAPESKLHIKGTVDTSQLIIDANSTQSDSHPLIRLRNAAGADLLHISSNGPTNSFFGYYAGSAGGGTFNTLIGGYAGIYNGGNEITAIGTNTISNNISGNRNTAVGSASLYGNTTGSYNTAIGAHSLQSNITGSYNTAVGEISLDNNQSGTYNTASGAVALYSNTTGGYNTADGFSALELNTTGGYNTAVGYQALHNISGAPASRNTGIGYHALYTTTSSQYNSAVGYNAGSGFDNGYNNVFVGANADVDADGYYNVIAIGQATICTASNQVTMGNSTTDTYRAYANWSNISDGRYKRNVQENVPGLDFINKLRPVTYNLDATGLDAFLHRNSKQGTPSGNKTANALNNNKTATPVNDDAARKIYNKALKEKETIVYTGFVAQEVENTAKKLGFNFSGVDAPKNENDVYGLRYAEFVVPLVKAVQEQQQMIADMQKRMQLLEEQNRLLLHLINKH